MTAVVLLMLVIMKVLFIIKDFLIMLYRAFYALAWYHHSRNTVKFTLMCVLQVKRCNALGSQHL